MTTVTPAGTSWELRQRLARAVFVLRWALLPLPLYGLFFPSLGPEWVALLAVYLAWYNMLLLWWSKRVNTPRRAAFFDVASFLGDTILIVYAMILYAPDRAWLGPVLAPLLIFDGALHFRARGALIASGILIMAGMVIASYREAILGFEGESQLAAFRAIFYIITAVFVSLVIRAIESYQYERTTLLTEIAAASARQETEAKYRQELERLARYDPVTAMPNQTYFNEQLGHAIADADRSHPVSLLLVKLLRFRSINGTFGYEAANTVLRAVSERFQHLPGEPFVARFTGDTLFGVILRNADWGAGMALASRIADVMHEPFAVDGYTLEIAAAVGAAVHPGHGDGPAALLRSADIALDTAKRLGNDSVLFSPDQDRYDPVRLSLVSELRTALDRDEVLPFFQPKVRLADGGVVGFEALARWQDPARGLISPGSFIPIVEQTSLIQPLTDHILSVALRESRRWSLAGHALHVAVNLSARHLEEPRVVQRIATLLQTSGVPPSALTLEITEGLVMTDPEGTIAMLGRLRDLGVGLSIDDFGTGYSSLAYLYRLPVSEVKIDKSFVVGLGRGDTSPAIVRAIIDVGHTLGLKVVAEGVEDQRSWEMLREAGCDIAQGYLVARAMPAAEATAWLDSRREAPVRAG